MRRIAFLILSVFFLQTGVSGQFTQSAGDKVLQTSGMILPFFNHRFYPESTDTFKKNRFNMDFAVIRFDGMAKKHIHYEIQLNFPAIYDSEVSDELLMQSTIEWRSRKDNFNIRAGYDKLPFSRSSLNPMSKSPFMQRPEMVRGKTFNRRDAGITLEKNFWNKRLNLFGGVYSGMGMASIVGDNDDNGKYLYVARVEASYPSKARDGEMDTDHIPLPNVSVGFGGMFSEKTVTTGTDYPLLTVDGKKRSLGGDFTFMFKGFTVIGEYVLYNVTPRDQTMLYGKPTDHYNASGQYLLVNYYFKKIKSLVAARYDQFDPSDLLKGNARNNLSTGIDFCLDGFNSVIKVHFIKRLSDTSLEGLDPWTDDQLRIGWQLKF
jgi:hypothetical protein